MTKVSRLKVSDLIADFLVSEGVTHVFGVTGGASIHLLHSLRAKAGIDPIFVHHEQSASMAADGFARVSENFGVAVATSGPGATNLVTGIAGAWFDSVPCLFLTGQVARYRLRGDLRTRQYGFQETDVIQMVSGITKFARQVLEPEEVLPTLRKAVEVMRSGRPGPVLVDIPDDIQRAFIEVVDEQTPPKGIPRATQVNEAERILGLFLASQRPTLVVGAGMASSERGRKIARQLIQLLAVPTLTTWRAKDLDTTDIDNIVGTFGTHGTRAGNFVIQNSDFTLVLGSRLSTRETGTPISLWARESKVVVVDIDSGEIEKFAALGRSDIQGVVTDCVHLAEELVSAIKIKRVGFPTESWQGWLDYVSRLKSRYEPVSVGESAPIQGCIDPYRFMQALSEEVPDHEHVFLDTGCTVAWTMQAFRSRSGVRLHHDCNNTAMGWALPAAIGGALSTRARRATCLVGDGSIMMNLQELATLTSARTDIVIFLLNNLGYGMVRQTEAQWLDSQNVGTNSGTGDLHFPEFSTLSKAFGLRYLRMDTEADIRGVIATAYRYRSCLVEVAISPSARVVPQARFGFPIEDGEPSLDRAEFASNMLIATHSPE